MKQSGESTIQFVNFDVFGHQVGVVFTTDVIKTTKRLFKVDTPDAEGLLFKYFNKARSVIVLNYDAGLGTLSHECFHAVWNIFKYHGIKLSDEGLAYHLGYLVRRVYGIQFAARKAKRTYYAKQKAKRKRDKK